jgi:hypothetical protein
MLQELDESDSRCIIIAIWADPCSLDFALPYSRRASSAPGSFFLISTQCCFMGS